jgi:hypothetical protein
MSHPDLIERSVKWLRGTMRCNPVFTGLASCSEIPDAIGWTSSYHFRGSIVVECKTSRSDFYADRKKYLYWEHPEQKWRYRRSRISRKEAAESGLVEKFTECMGDFRYFVCEPMIITVEMIAHHAPDHGLVWIEGRRMHVVLQAPRREQVDRASEIRYLRFAIINRKQPAIAEPEVTQPLLIAVGEG